MKIDELKSSKKKVISKYESAADEQQKTEEVLRGQQVIEQLKLELPKQDPETNHESKEESKKLDIKSLISSNEGQKGRSKTIYLDNKVLVKVKRIAEEQGVSESKVINDLLRHVLF